MKKLRFLERTHKRSIGTVHELTKNDKLRVEYAPTISLRDDGFTKCLTPAKCLAARDMMWVIPNQNALRLNLIDSSSESHNSCPKHVYRVR